jgi:hypothetical protein
MEPSFPGGGIPQGKATQALKFASQIIGTYVTYPYSNKTHEKGGCLINLK